MPTIAQILSFLDDKAPLSLAEAWDNCGLLVGHEAEPVTGGLLCLDITPAAIQAAKEKGANLLISHHPVIFDPLRRLEADSMPYRLAAEGLSAICLHTNLDRAAGGVNDRLCRQIGLTDVTVAPDELCRIGLSPLSEPEQLAGLISDRLDTAVRLHTSGRSARKVAVCGGAGGDYLIDLAKTDTTIDTVLTGELKHHEWLQLNALGLNVLEAGHYATEAPALWALADWLTEAFGRLPWHIHTEKPYQ